MNNNTTVQLPFQPGHYRDPRHQQWRSQIEAMLGRPLAQSDDGYQTAAVLVSNSIRMGDGSKQAAGWK